MFGSIPVLLSTAKALAACGWQMAKMLARFYALVIPATVRVVITRPKKRRNRTDRYLVECGDWKLRASIQHSGRGVFLSSLSVTKRTVGPGSISTATTPALTAPPARDASSHLEQLGLGFQP